MIVFLLRIVLMLLSIVAVSMLIPLGFAIYHRETDTVFAFLLPMVAFLIPGILAFIFKQKSKPVFSMKAVFQTEPILSACRHAQADGRMCCRKSDFPSL